MTVTVHNRYGVRYMTFIRNIPIRISIHSTHKLELYVSPWPQSDERRYGTQVCKPSTNLPKHDSDVWKTVLVVKEHPTVPGLKCISTAQRRLGGRAQLVDVRPDQDDGAGAHGPRRGPRRGRQACVLPRVPPPREEQAAEGKLHVQADSDSDQSDEEDLML